MSEPAQAVPLMDPAAEQIQRTITNLINDGGWDTPPGVILFHRDPDDDKVAIAIGMLAVPEDAFQYAVRRFIDGELEKSRDVYAIAMDMEFWHLPYNDPTPEQRAEAERLTEARMLDTHPERQERRVIICMDADDRVYVAVLTRGAEAPEMFWGRRDADGIDAKLRKLAPPELTQLVQAHATRIQRAWLERLLD
ncbi:hypothetical protein ACFY05_32880 [Microtetraspora fusca]|uniref:Uncharacterized protein n=1 Tax=Microtetraspora fusca TaxID=1997 RepID=A0ABW6VE43_MICFU